MRGTRTRWTAAAVTLALAVPVGTASAHRADFTFTGDAAKQVGAYQDGTSIFTQRAADTPGAFTLVGHNPLESRGMNAAIAVNKGFVYIGSRTDGSNGRTRAGVMIVDARNPEMARFPLNEASGSIAHEAVGAYADAQLNGDVTWAATTIDGRATSAGCRVRHRTVSVGVAAPCHCRRRLRASQHSCGPCSTCRARYTQRVRPISPSARLCQSERR